MRRTREQFRRIGVVFTTVSVVGSMLGTVPSAAWAQASPPAKPSEHHHAQAPNPKKLLASAQSKRAAGDYAGALADYQAADAIVASPVTIEGIAVCHDNLGHFDDALTWYREFLAKVPPSMESQAVAARARVAVISGMPGHLRIDTPASNAIISIDGVAQTGPAPIDLDLPPGKHRVRITAPDHDPIEKDVEIASRAQERVLLEPALTPLAPLPSAVVVVAATPPPPAPMAHLEPAPPSLVPAYVVGALALVGVGVGVGAGISALHYKSTYNNNPTSSTANNGESAALVSDLGFGVAVTLGVTSIMLFARGGSSAAPATTAIHLGGSSPVTLTPTPFMTPHGGGAGALLTF